MYLPMAKVPPIVNLSAEDQAQLVRWKSTQGTPQQVALRCRLVLAAAEGYPDLEIASHHEVNRHTVALWRERVQEHGEPALEITQPQAAPEPHLQAVARSQVHREIDRCGGSVFEPTAEGDRVVRGGKEPNPSLGPHPAGPAPEKRAVRHDDTRRQAERNRHALRRAQGIGRKSHGKVQWPEAP